MKRFRFAASFTFVMGCTACTMSFAGIPFGPTSPLANDAATDSLRDRFADIASNDAGTLGVVWSGAETDASTGEKILFARSVDGGTTWEDVVVIADDAGPPRRNVGPALAGGPDGVWVIVWVAVDQGERYFSRSTDDGQTWSAPSILPGGMGSALPGDSSELEIATDGVGTFVVIGTEEIDDDDKVAIVTSSDNGLTWARVAEFQGSKPTIATDGAGNWVVAWAGFGGLTARSIDNGLTWSSPIVLPGVSQLLSNLSSMATDADGTWVLVYARQDAAPGAPPGIFAHISEDAGISWSLPELISPPTVPFGPRSSNPDVAENAAGEFLVVYVRDRDIYNVVRSSGGAWSQETIVTPDAPFTPISTPSVLADDYSNWLVVWGSSDSLGGLINADSDILIARSLLDCGNGVLDPGESCDDGNNDHGDACGIDCDVNVCGDGVVNQDSEECDDGNTESGDGCSENCVIEDGSPTRVFMVTQGMDVGSSIPGTDAIVEVAPGATLVVDTFISSPVGLASYQLVYGCQYPSSDSAAPDLIYDQELNPVDPSVVVESSIQIDQSRPDWLFANNAGVLVGRDQGYCTFNTPCTMSSDCPFNSLCENGVCIPTPPRITAVTSLSLSLPGQVRYLGEISYLVPTDASGTYRIVFECCSNSDGCLLDGNCALEGGSTTNLIASDSFFTHDGLLVVVDRLEACCLPDGSCEDVEPTDCDMMGGTSGGPLTDCGDDADNDGVWPQCGDECPNNPAKTEPGICGCNAPDNDTDADGVVDCIDGCPFDSDKTAPGLCGCGQEESNCAPVPAVSGFGMLILSLAFAMALIWKSRDSNWGCM